MNFEELRKSLLKLQILIENLDEFRRLTGKITENFLAKRNLKKVNRLCELGKCREHTLSVPEMLASEPVQRTSSSGTTLAIWSVV